MCPPVILLHLLGSLKRHAKSHEGKTRYDCTECDKSFTQLGDILRHQRNHTGNDSCAR